jgi:DNA-binding NtrC family response regulator
LSSGEATARVCSDVIVIEDDAALRANLVTALRSASLSVVEAETCQSALRRMKEGGTQVIVTDLNLPDGDVLELIPELRKMGGEPAVFVVTGYGTIDVAVRAVKSGAEDFLTKPIDIEKLVSVVRGAVNRRRRARSGARTRFEPTPFAAKSDAMQRVEDQVARLHNADCSVLILGETGTGKSVLARRIHDIGVRATGPFVDVNCGALSREFVESELFGHERGAFTGAHNTKAGLLDTANQGTLFLDEIGDVDLQVQPKLLKVLEEKRFRRMGDVKERSVDVRLVAATHHDLLRAIEHKSFRADLYYRISTVTITMPSLRDRALDVIPLALHLLGNLSGEPVDIASDAREILLAHSWPGNIRELKNVLERALLVRDGPVVRARDLRFDVRSSENASPPPSRASSGAPSRPQPESSPESMRELEREHIMRTLLAEGGRVEAAARRMDMPRSTLYQKLKTHGIQMSSIRTTLRESNGAIRAVPRVVSANEVDEAPQRRRLLIVDDVESLLFAQRAYFTRMGWSVDTTKSGGEARELVREHEYDAAITDLRLGDDDDEREGFDLVRFIRTTSPSTRVILHTAYGSPSLQGRAAELGVFRFVSKPQALVELARLLDGS